MKLLKYTVASLVTITVLTSPFAGLASDTQKTGKPKPYPLATCIVTGEKLGEMGAPFVHIYKDREIKFCCKSCLKNFNKDADRYLKKIEAAEKQAKK